MIKYDHTISDSLTRSLASCSLKVFRYNPLTAAFFSTIMTLLFKLRDRALVWQKGIIKW